MKNISMGIDPLTQELQKIWDDKDHKKYGFWQLEQLVRHAIEANQKFETQVSHDGKHWERAKEEPYYNMGIEAIKCFFGFHEWVISKRYRGTKICFRCGKRKTGLKHY